MRKLLSVGIVALLAFIVVGCSGNVMSSNWSNNNLENELVGRSWTITADSVNGYATYKTTFNDENLSSMHVENTNSSGEVAIVIIQDDLERSFDVTGKFSGDLDLSEFSPGPIQIRPSFAKANDVNLKLTW